MARVVPDGWKEFASAETLSAGARRELETLEMLASALPDDYTVYHAVHWTNIERGYAVFGEIDFVIVNRAGDILLIEQKTGFLGETAEGLIKQYPGRTKSVPVQMARSADALRSKVSARPEIGLVRIDSLLFCPHYAVRDVATAGIVPERIVDARRRDQLPAVVQRLLPPGAVTDRRELHRFLRDVIRLEPDVNALIGRAKIMVTRVSGGLAYWARQLDFTPYRLRVTGTAGSGKTQLALAEYRDSVARGQRPLYVCFNRPLADHFAAIVADSMPGVPGTPGGVACTFHALCERLVRAAGETPDFSSADAFEALVRRATELPVPAALIFDTLIVDEGQDWPEAWRDQAFRHARPDARMLWLEDPLQNLYGRPPLQLPGWIGVRSTANYRSPRPVVRFLQQLAAGEGIEAASPLDASEIGLLTYADPADLLQKVKLGIKECYAAGFRKEDVAVISYRGREHSHLLRHDRLGDFSFRSFTGAYDLLGHPVYSAGDILMESVFRFKGQAAPAVVLAEIDFESLDEAAVRRLFVGATRAAMKLVLVASEHAAGILLERLG